MSNQTLTISILGSLATAALYLYVGHVLRHRPVSDHARLANGMFVLWWQSLGGIGLVGSAVLLVYIAGMLEVWLYQAYVTFVLLVIFVALWGLQFYLVYLYTGSKRSFTPLGVFYAVLFLATLALIEYTGEPTAITDNGWSLQREPKVDLGRAFGLAFSVLLLGPQLVAAVAYARLYRKTADRTQRYRIALITGSIIVWFGTSLVGAAIDASDGVAWQVFSRVLGFVAVVVILMAYKPPAWIRRQYGIRGLDGKDGHAAPPESPAQPS